MTKRLVFLGFIVCIGSVQIWKIQKQKVDPACPVRRLKWQKGAKLIKIEVVEDGVKRGRKSGF